MKIPMVGLINTKIRGGRIRMKHLKEVKLRKSQNTSVSERSNVTNEMWRKKVDNSIFRYDGTVIPRWMVANWDLEKFFSRF